MTTTSSMSAHASQAIIKATQFDPTSIRFGPVEKNRLGGKFVPIVDAHGKKVRIKVQTPPLHLPFGVSSYREKPDGDVTNYSLDVSFRDDDDPRVTAFLEKIQDLDDHLKESALKNSIEWFGKQKTAEVLEDSYRELTKKHKDENGRPSGKYPPIMKIKIDVRDGVPTCKFFDASESGLKDAPQIPIESVPSGSTVKVIMEASQIWQVGSSWGMTWRARQCLVTKKPDRMDGNAFSDDDEDRDDETCEIEDGDD